MKKILFFLVFTTLIFSCAKEPVQPEFLDGENIEVDAIIEKHLETNNSIFDWNTVSLNVLWAAVEQSDNIVTVGYGEEHSFALATTAELNEQKEALLAKIFELEQEAATESLEFDDVFLRSHKTLAYFDIIIKSKATLKYLKEKNNLRYLEPGNYIFKKKEKANYKIMEIGCGKDPETINSGEPQNALLVAVGFILIPSLLMYKNH